MTAPLRRLLLVLISALPLLPFRAVGAPASQKPAPANSASAAPATRFPKAWPSFLTPGEVFCLDELDFNAFAHTGKFHTRGSQESCTRVGQLTRVVVLNQSGPKSQIRVVSGAMEASVGWTNARLPLAGPKPQ